MKRGPWLELLSSAIDGLEDWEASWGEAPIAAPTPAAARAVAALVERLAGNYPFFHPRYAGQMLKPPHPIAWVAYATAALINPNNHALDGGPPTAAMERDAVARLAAMLGFSPDLEGHLGHLTGGGTMANLEALWVARELRPGKRILSGANAHYTHARVCGVLGVEHGVVAIDERGRIDPGALARELDRGDVGTVVATPGTTGFGAVDPVDEIAALCRERGVRLHIDAAYGGFFSLLARRDPPLVTPAPFAAIAEADSVVIDPHKHGLQPYGCGCVIFRDPSVASIYAHESPYTYFTSSERHLGEISLECSRAGAAAAALWATIEAIELEPERGLGEMLAGGRRAALGWSEAIAVSDVLIPVMEPETDIVCFAVAPAGRRVAASEIGAWSAALFEKAVAPGSDQFYLATQRVAADLLRKNWPEADIDWDVESVTTLRSVLMKPEHQMWWPRIHDRIEGLAIEVIQGGRS
jgi:glutamate/tyrosine decarboxylase-like PLP-dependent enzyme